ncbi:protein crumbs homolog 1-like isoform X2 [Ruditapes philippinarum]|uniref:protein crumbs homolog 1-like isoform X2 n=1 Tax=Ruditapes philippinarum TaxID=129788 RepID=UPI00295A7902|nr:protein crumbs homolog 1-like isoform X2 [Ruditapes philippinarum]
MDKFSYLLGIFMFLTGMVYGQVTEDLGPVGPSFDTCETINCPVNSKCVDDMGYVSCLCNPGKTGINCTIDDPCLERKKNCPAGSVCYGDCDPNVICEGATGFAHCRGCVAGWTGLHCEEDINECDDTINPCLNNGKCNNIKGDFKCICARRWKGKVCDCEKGTACDFEESKTTVGPTGKGTQLICNISVFIVSLITYTIWTV